LFSAASLRFSTGRRAYRELAALDAVAGVLHRIRRERRQLDVGRGGLDVEEEIARERVDLAGDLERCDVVDLAAQLDLARRLRRDRTDGSADAGEIRRVVRPDEEIAEVDVAALQRDLADRMFAGIAAALAASAIFASVLAAGFSARDFPPAASVAGLSGAGFSAPAPVAPGRFARPWRLNVPSGLTISRE
jgi:hypothetical protein